MHDEWDKEKVNADFKRKYEKAKNELDKILKKHEDRDTVQYLKLDFLVDLRFYGYFYERKNMNSKEECINLLKDSRDKPIYPDQTTCGKPCDNDKFKKKWEEKIDYYIKHFDSQKEA